MGVRRTLHGIAFCGSLLVLALIVGVGFRASDASTGVPRDRPVSVFTSAGREASRPLPTPTVAPTPAPASSPLPASSPSSSPRPVTAVSVEPDPTPEPPAQPPPTAAIVDLTNQLRAEHALAPLAVSPSLTNTAQTYAETMALEQWFSHQGPDGSHFTARAEAAGYTDWLYLGENLYRGPRGDSAVEIVTAWAASPSHQRVMLSVHATEIGVGCHDDGVVRWCVQEFGAR